MYRKNTYVFWVQTDTGVLLQNVNTNQFIELDKAQEKVWEYLDGTFSKEAIVQVLKRNGVEKAEPELLQTVESTIAILKSYDLISQN
jgi:hypothetical protein